MNAYQFLCIWARTASVIAPRDIRSPNRGRHAVRKALARAEREGVIEFLGYRREANRPVPQYASKVIDLTATFPPEHWKQLAVNYVRFHRATESAEGFTIDDMELTASRLGCPKGDRALWADVLAAEGLECRDGRWFMPACCPECQENHT
jgi:hypothetical protein